MRNGTHSASSFNRMERSVSRYLQWSELCDGVLVQLLLTETVLTIERG